MQLKVYIFFAFVLAQQICAAQTYDVVWVDAVGATASATTLTKTAIDGWGNSGAASLHQLPANSDGWIEYTVTTTTQRRAFGFSDNNTNEEFFSIDYDFYLGNDSKVYVKLNGTQIQVADMVTGDVLRLERTGSNIYFKLNGTAIHTVTSAYTGAMIIDAALYNNGAVLENIKASFGTPSFHPIVWTTLTGVAINGTSITKTRSDNYGTGAAFTAAGIAAGINGYVEATAAETNKTRMIGLASSNVDNSTNIAFAIQLKNNGDLHAFENGIQVASLGTYATGTVVKIAREGTQIKYYANNTLKFTSTQTSASVLYVDVAFNHSLASLQNIKLCSGNVPDQEEYQALKQLYDSLGGASWTNKSNWPSQGTWPLFATSEAFGTWSGVGVINGDVSTISMQSNNLAGKIPAAISKLSKLKYLWLAYNNNITGTIPTSIGSLTELLQISLDNNKIGGSIPSSIGSLTNLTHLTISFNQLTGSIPSTIGSMSALQQLSLYSNGLTGSIPTTIGSLSNLKMLYLQSNALSGSIPASIGNLQGLEYLYLNYNNLSGSLPTEIGNLSALKYLALDGNQLSGSIPSSIGSLSNLKSFTASYNQFSGSIPSTLGGLTALEHLQLHVNSLTDAIPSQIGNLTNLISLYLQSNTLSGNIPTAIGNLNNLQYLLLNNNNFSGSIPCLSNTALQYLQLGYNQLTGSIPSCIENLSALKTFSVQNNQLTGNLPSTIGNLSQLQGLYVQQNQLSGLLPGTLGSLSNLTDLYINNNSFTGALPQSLGNLANLKYLYASANGFTGNIPSTFSGLTELYLVYLDHNNLAGELPSFIGNWTKLGLLSIGHNNFQGAFPSSIGNCSVLTHIWADGNLFTSFPASILTVPGSYINLDDNKITTIPGFGSHVNKTGLTLSVKNNYLDFAQLEPQVAAGLLSFVYLPQNNPKPVGTIDVPLNRSLSINAPDGGTNGVYVWEKNVNGVWVNINSQNQSGQSYNFIVAAVTVEHAGSYRYTVSNTLITGLTFASGAFQVRITDAINESPVLALYNGQITAARWRTDRPYEVEGEGFSGLYTYTYDDRYQISDATYFKPDFVLNTFSSEGNAFRLTGMGYDPNGNITKLKRYKEAGDLQHDFTYQYEENKNKLTSVSGHVNVYTYNNLGQLVGEDKLSGDDQYIEYDVSGKVTKVYSDAGRTQLKIENLYDERGFRQAKVNHASNRTTWYIRDNAGNVISIYEQEGLPDEANVEPLVETEVPVYGSGKIGTLHPNQDASLTYEITDHLRNVRALVRDNINVYTATMEDTDIMDLTNPRVQEMQYFNNLFETEKTDANMNHTDPIVGVVSNPDKSAYLFWQEGVAGMEASDKSVGPSMMLKVSAGDSVDMETWVRYQEKVSYTRDIDLLLLSQALGSSFAFKGAFEGYTISQTNTIFETGLQAAGFMNDAGDNTRPYAYINYMILDANMALITADRRQVPATAGFTPGEEGLPNLHQKLDFAQPVVIPQNGYIYIWVSNESEDTKVWFDDIQITHRSTIVTQATDYGVWGDILREQKTDESIYRFGFQAQFSERDLETGWNHFELREYDPLIARWTTTDPYGEFWSPYVGMGNDPGNLSDPDGGCTTCPIITALYNFLADPVNQEAMSGVSFSEPVLVSPSVLDEVNDLWDSDLLRFAKNVDPNLEGLETSTKFLAALIDGNGAEIKEEGLNVVIEGAGAIPILKIGGTTAKVGTKLWSSTKKLNSVKNAFNHWKKHALEFPEFVNSKQYVEGAKNFLNNSPTGTLIKQRGSDILKYHPSTNTFGVMDATTGVPRTMFRPTDGMQYWLKQ
jgi:RHS repeat-associated protein